MLCVNEYKSFLNVRTGGNFGLSLYQEIKANLHRIHSCPDWSHHWLASYHRPRSYVSQRCGIFRQKVRQSALSNRLHRYTLTVPKTML